MPLLVKEMIKIKDLSENLLETQQKIEKLILHVTECRIKIKNLQDENDKNTKIIQDLNQEIELLQKKQRQLKIAKNVRDTYLGTKDVKQEIDHYIKEIDKCIALLSS